MNKCLDDVDDKVLLLLISNKKQSEHCVDWNKTSRLSINIIFNICYVNKISVLIQYQMFETKCTAKNIRYIFSNTPYCFILIYAFIIRSTSKQQIPVQRIFSTMNCSE